MNLVLALACDRAEVAPDGKLNVEGIYNEIAAAEFPATQPLLTVVLVIEWDMHDVGEQPIRADLIGPDGRMVVTIQGDTEVQLAPDNEVPPQTRMVLPLENVHFETAGRYWLRLKAGKEVVEALRLYVHRVHQP